MENNTTSPTLLEIDNEDDSNERQSTIPDDKIPKKGMEFDTDEAAFEFYNEYAKLVGFSVRKQYVHTNCDKKVLDRTLCCSWEGFRKEDKRDVNVRRPRAITRNGCLAMLTYNARQTGKYVFDEFIAAHNGHELVSSDKTHFLRSHRIMTVAQTSQADAIDNSGIAPKAGYELMAQQMGGRDKLGFIFQDYKNYLRTKRTIEMSASDTGGVLEFLQERQLEDPNFFSAIQVDVNGLITNIFWTDTRMMVDFDYFGDIVSFDTTFKKNKEGRPFAMFVGVNHHKQTVIFGAALLYDETIPTFKWLFATFTKAMRGKTPQTILTDQDAAMDRALKETWGDNTYHRLCIWHIYQNAASHLKPVFECFADFAEDFKSCIYDYDEEEDFVDAWKKMLEKYGLQTNEWLEKLYGIKEKWALVYGRQKFCGAMISTQRSESMNNALKGYVSYKTDMLRFFKHFQSLVDNRRHEELKADFRTSQSFPELPVRVRILKHALRVYTHEVFKLFQVEFGKTYDYEIDLCSVNEEISEYKVTPYGKRHNKVTYNSSTQEVSCTCKKFEFAGILCSHSLKVFGVRNVTRIPDIYIKKRWTKNAKKGLSEELFNAPSSEMAKSLDENEEKRLIGVRYTSLSHFLKQLGTRGSITDEAYQIVQSHVAKALEEIDATLEKRTTKELQSASKSAAYESHVPRVTANQTLHGTMTPVDEVTITGLKVKERKNGNSGKRLKSGLEKATGKKRKKHNSKDINDSEDCLTGCPPNEHGALPSSSQIHYGDHSLPTQEYFSSLCMPAQNPQINNSLFYASTNQQARPYFTQLLQQQEQLLH